MVEQQIINKILKTKDLSILTENQLDKSYFSDMQKEVEYLLGHYDEFGNVPDTATFLDKFQDFDVIDVTESDEYLVVTLREEALFRQSVPIIQHSANLLKDDANKAVEYLHSAIKSLEPNYNLGGIDIISQAEKRYDEYEDRKKHKDNWFFTTGFPELDDAVNNIQRGEELFCLFARTNQGKSWVLEKICTHIWQLGFNVGYVSPEMSASNIGYRFDTLCGNFSNRQLMRGKDGLDDYKTFIDDLKSKDNKFMVATPKDFNRVITVSKLRNYVKQYKLDALAIDGITYITDERGHRTDNKTISLTHISEDLMSLSMELSIPILIVVQANRGGVNNDEEDSTPDLENIRDSDGIAHNASKVISLRQNKDNVLTMQVKKNRSGRVGDKIQYIWNPDVGEFSPIGGNIPTNRPQRKIIEKEDIF